MDSIKQIWIESSRSASPLDSPSLASMQRQQQHPPRPPPLRTSCTYDDDETFNNVGLNLLSRYKSLGLSVQEVILATLISPKQRASFLDGLCMRLDRNTHNNQQLLQALDKTFGKDLQELVQAESKDGAGSSSGGGGPYYHPYSSNNPVAPRHTTTTASRRHSQQEQHPNQGPDHTEISMSSSSTSSGMSFGAASNGSGKNQPIKKKSTPRRFFPDTECMGSFFRSKRRVQNIDWKLAEAVKQVEHLQLDGHTTTPNTMATSPVLVVNRHYRGNNNNNSSNNNGTYEPPTSG